MSARSAPLGEPPSAGGPKVWVAPWFRSCRGRVVVVGFVVGCLRGFDHTRAAGACVARGPASALPDWPAPDGPAASFPPSAGMGAVSLALEGGWILVVNGGGSSLRTQGRSGLFAGGWPLVKANRAEISLSAWRGRICKRPFRARSTRACAGAAFESFGEVALFYKPRREWVLAAVQPRREGKVGELRSLRTWPAGRGAYLLSLSVHCLAQ